MELTWYGMGCFRIVERGLPALVMDPFDEAGVGLSLPRARVDIVTLSTLLAEPENARWKGLRGVSRTIAGPGEFEIGGLFVTGIATFKDRKRGADLGQNVVYSVNMGGVVICHLGELGSTLTQTQVEMLGLVNVLLLPVGMPEALSPTMASEVVSLIEPDIVIPMQYAISEWHAGGAPREPVARFLKEMGIAQSECVPSLKLTSGQLPEETQVVLLEPQPGG